MRTNNHTNLVNSKRLLAASKCENDSEIINDQINILPKEGQESAISSFSAISKINNGGTLIKQASKPKFS